MFSAPIDSMRVTQYVYRLYQRAAIPAIWQHWEQRRKPLIALCPFCRTGAILSAEGEYCLQVAQANRCRGGTCSSAGGS